MERRNHLPFSRSGEEGELGSRPGWVKVSNRVSNGPFLNVTRIVANTDVYVLGWWVDAGGQGRWEFMGG